MPHFRLLPAVALLVAVGALATAQQPGTAAAAPVPLLSRLLPYVGDKTFQKELKLTDAQAKRLVAFRQKVWDETYNTAPKDLKTDEQFRAVVAELKAVLSAEQLKRATQLAVLAVLADRGPFGFALPSFGTIRSFRTIPAGLLARHGEIAAALKLDDTQAKLAEIAAALKLDDTQAKLTGFVDRSPTVYLTPAQTAALKALMGDAPATRLDAQNDRRMWLYFLLLGSSLSLDVGLPAGSLFAPDVQKDLGLTADQIKTVTALEEKYPDLVRDGGGFGGFRTADSDSSPAERKKAHEARTAEAKAAFEKLLTADQKKRLEQIARQMSPFGRANVFAANSELGEAIGVTDEQRKSYQAARAAHAAAVIKAVASDEALEKVKAAAAEAGKARDAAIAKILTAEQVAKKQDWLGRPFTGSTGGGGGVSPTEVRKRTFGRYTNELVTLARYPRMREELKLTEAQLKKVQEGTTALNEKFGPGLSVPAEKRTADRSAFVKKALDDTLTREQRERLLGLMIQIHESPVPLPWLGGGFARYATAASLPGVAEAIKLTAEQKQELINGISTADVLTADQKAALKKLMGKPVDVARLLSIGPAVTVPRIVPLAQDLTHWDTIKVTPEQVGKLATAFNAYALATPGRDGRPEDREAAVKAVTKAVEAALTVAQAKRLEQLDLQANTARSLLSALLGTENRPSAARNELGITADQAGAIRAAAEDLGARAELLQEAAVSSMEGQKARTALRRKLRDQLDARIEGVMTAEQKKKWKELIGEPRPGFTKSPLTGRDRGGMMGGGRGFGP